MPNCTFKIARRDSAEYQMVTTGPDGTALVEGLEEDWYQVSENKAGDGHLIDGTVRDVQLVTGKTTTLRYVNFVKPSLTIKRIDEATGQGLDNAVIRVWREGVDEHQDYTTQGGGYIRLADLEPGFLLCQEIKSPAGFVLDNTVHRIELKAGEEHRDVTTGANGIITESLKPGYIQIKELPYEGYTILNPEQEILVERGKVATAYFENEPENPITKAKEGAPLGGAIFKIYNNKMELVDTITTDTANGISVSKPLPLGVYGIKETASPEYYFTDGKMFYAEIKAHNDLIKFKVKTPLWS